MSNTSTQAAVQAQYELLTFRLGEEEYGIDILQIQEIRSYEPPTRIANAPPHVKGVVNLRGVIVPVIDLRLRMGYREACIDHLTAVVVLNVAGSVSGVMVDAVSDVVNLPGSMVKPVPAVGQQDGGCEHHIRGIATLEERLLMLLNIEALMTDNLPETAGLALQPSLLRPRAAAAA